MSQFRDLLLEAWKESCQHRDIASLVADLAPRLQSHLPVAALVVREFVTARKSVETIASAAVAGEKFLPVDRPVECNSSEWGRLRAWARNFQPGGAASAPPTTVASLLTPHDVDGDVLAVPLLADKEPLGALVMVLPPPQRWTNRLSDMAVQLAAPFSAALLNERRQRETSALRQSAEADRASLLTRLGRKQMLESVVGAEKGLRFVMERVELVAAADAPVLILGETGSGKEVIARAIHERSDRNGKPFIRVNCGAIPPELIDSQLFGHEKGSFTGASDQRQGWFERADGGTLFLDEIGELPLPAQVRLLRVLQDHSFERVGGQQAVHVDVRIVAATHRELAEMVARGTFRQDLWYRINVFPILLPRLADRSEDIPDLVRHFAYRAADRFGLPHVEPTATDLMMLASYDWPGNVRELAAVVDRATILGRGKALDVSTALGWSHQEAQTAHAAKSVQGVPSADATALGAKRPANIVSLSAAVAQHIERALAAAHGKIEGRKGAAQLLEINPHTLRAKMRKLGIDWSKFRE